MMQRTLSRTFGALLALLIACFFFVPEQQQRNWALYLAAAAAHGFLGDGQLLARAFRQGGWVVPALLAMPLLSLAWRDSIAVEQALDLLLAGWCILAIHIGMLHLAAHRPEAIERLKQVLLLAANLGALLSIGHWAATADPEYPRLIGWLGLDTPVHASILLLSATLPVCSGIGQGRLSRRWLLACIAPWSFALLGASRMALAAYLLMLVVALRPGPRVVAAVISGALAGFAALAFVLGDAAFDLIWLDRGLSFRPMIWGEIWSSFRNCNPLIGCGIANPITIEISDTLTAKSAHSLYLAALHHQGFLGLGIFLLAMGWLLASNRQRLPLEAPPRDWLLMLGYALVANITSGDHLVVRTTLFWCYFWLPVMALTATSAISPRPPLAPAAQLGVNDRGSSPAGSA